MSISARLKYIAGLVTPGNSIADIGTDHGFIPVYCVKEGISPKALAVDISKGSLEKAIELTAKLGLSSQIECRLSDGLEKIAPYEADTVIIAGMGGILMANIIESHPEVFSTFKEAILSPHRDADLIRCVLKEHGFQIRQDDTIIDKNKQYVVIKAVNLL